MKEPVIELRLWRQFAAVAEELHFGRAARSLHMTQPPLTQAIAQLERLLDVRLFERTKRSVQLTAAGEALLPQVREPLVLALPESHPMAGSARVSLPQVLAEPLVIFPRRIVPSLHDAVLGMYHAAGREPRIVQEAIQMQTIVNLVSAGLGIAWVPESVRQFQRSGVVYRQVGGKQAASVPE